MGDSLQAQSLHRRGEQGSGAGCVERELETREDGEGSELTGPKGAEKRL